LIFPADLIFFSGAIAAHPYITQHVSELAVELGKTSHESFKADALYLSDIKPILRLFLLKKYQRKEFNPLEN